MGLLSILALWTDKLQRQQGIEAQSSAWYQKVNPTFSDAIALVRQHLWAKQQFLTSLPVAEVNYLNQPLIQHLCPMMTSAA